MINLLNGNCLDLMRSMPDNSVDSIVTDPPYGLNFMGKKWDCSVPSVEIWAECLRVLKPGGHLLAFAGTRTQHRMAVNIEDAGFEIRDMIAWVYGSGFPKSLNVSKAIDKAAGAEREVVGTKRSGLAMNDQLNDDGWHNARAGEVGKMVNITAPATDAAHQWQGWGTALKPALEPITMARKPLVGTVAANVLAYGTGALNIDGCRIPGESTVRVNAAEMGYHGGNLASEYQTGSDAGRWPANLIHDGSEGPTDLLGDAARFFYCAKASKADREGGLEGAPDRVLAMSNQAKAELARGNMHEGESGMNTAKVRKNHHPTVKPTDLIRYLCRLVTPPKGIVLDPFMGSGSTGKAAVLEGFSFVGMELNADYFKIAQARVSSGNQSDSGQCGLFDGMQP